MAISAPIPLVAPVTITTFSVKLRFIFCFKIRFGKANLHQLNQIEVSKNKQVGTFFGQSVNMQKIIP
jgi:hypothetical protein